MFHVSSSPVTSTGSACGTSCFSLEALTSEAGMVAWCSDTQTEFDGNGTVNDRRLPSKDELHAFGNKGKFFCWSSSQFADVAAQTAITLGWSNG
jgi:hypothetical protein